MRGRLLLLLAIAGAGACLRPPVIGISPLLDQIGADLDLSAAGLGVLSTLPVLCFGAAALATPRWVRRFGDARLLAGCLVLLAVAQFARLGDGVAVLFAGTVLVGLAIGVGNTTLPILIKRWFADRIPTATAVYTVSLVGAAAVAAGVVIPIQHALDGDWRGPVAALALPAATIAVAWVWLAHRRSQSGDTLTAGTLWRDRLAWNVTAFMGFQSLGAYAVMVWLPTIAIDRGMSAGEGGALLGLGMAMQGVGALSMPLLIRGTRDQRPALILTSSLTAVGVATVVFAPVTAIWAGTVVLSFGQGASFALAIAFIGLRSSDPQAAGVLSGMTQSFGYLIAAIGPFGAGALRAISGGWTLPAIGMLACCAAMLAFGMPAARTGHVVLSGAHD